MRTDLSTSYARSITGGRACTAALIVAGLATWVFRPTPEQGWLGVTLDQATSEGRAATRLASILPDSPALRVGLVAGDLVRAAGGRRIGPPRDLSRTVRRGVPGAPFVLTIERGGAVRTITVILEARPPEVYRLLEADRDAWQEPDRVLDLLAVRPGSSVADVGAGSGYFTERLAARLDESAHLIAIEIDEEALSQLSTRFPHVRFPEIEIRRGTARDPTLQPHSLDAILMVDTYHELTEPLSMLAALRRALRPGGRFVVVDRPATEYRPGAHDIPESRVVAQAELAGFTRRQHSDLARQFAVVFE